MHACAYLAFCIMHTIFILEAENEGDIIFLVVFHNSPFALKRSLASLVSIKSSKRGYIIIHIIIRQDYGDCQLVLVCLTVQCHIWHLAIFATQQTWCGYQFMHIYYIARWYSTSMVYVNTHNCTLVGLPDSGSLTRAWYTRPSSSCEGAWAI